jgi:phosphate:Na+ symporter
VIFGLLGGLGVFLVGMILLGDGLRDAAGGALRSLLQRFARTPARAVVSGAGVTALVQSSSATTLTTIGFVSAGLLTFPQAVGLIFGANLGTTSTGWLVAILGFKVNLGAVALPLVGVGALLRLLGRGRWSHGGMALAGFGLIFLGIDLLQEGMGEAANRLDPARLPGATLGGRLLLLGAGTAMAVVMQSSSAAVATTLTALHAGGIGLEQAALLVVGQNVGTSVTAILAALGGQVPVRRTAVAHTLFNLVTAAVALVLLPLLLRGAVALAGPDDPATAVAIFHSGFNLLGVLLLCPVLGGFAALVERLVPESRPSLLRNLDPSVAGVPAVAVEAARQSALGVRRLLFGELARLLERAAEGDEPGGAMRGEPRPDGGRVRELAPAVAGLRGFLARVPPPPGPPESHGRLLAMLHVTDHLDRLEMLRQDFGELGALPRNLAPLATRLAETLRTPDGAAEVPALEALSKELADARRTGRARILEEMSRGEVGAEVGHVGILHLKRMDRVAYHAWRASHHLEVAGGGTADAEGAQPSEGSSSV